MKHPVSILLIKMLLGKGLQKLLWPYAVQPAAYIHDRCYNERTKNSQFQTMTGRNQIFLKNVGVWIRLLCLQTTTAIAAPM